MNYELAKAERTLRYLQDVLNRLQQSGDGASPADLDKALYDVDLQRLEVERLRAPGIHITTIPALHTERITIMADPVPDPTQMGLAQEALDLLKKAGASVEEIASCISCTGKEAGSYLTALVGRLKSYFAKQPMATTAPSKPAIPPGTKRGALILLALLSFAGSAEACHRGKRGQAQQPAVTYPYYQQAQPNTAPPSACQGSSCAPAQLSAPPVLYYQAAPGGCAGGSCAPSGGRLRRR